MQNIRAKIISTEAYSPGSEAVRITAAPVIVSDRSVSFDEENPVEAVFLPMAWNRPGDVAAYAASQIGEVGRLVFAGDDPTGIVPSEFRQDLPIVEFFFPGR